MVKVPDTQVLSSLNYVTSSRHFSSIFTLSIFVFDVPHIEFKPQCTINRYSKIELIFICDVLSFVNLK